MHPLSVSAGQHAMNSGYGDLLAAVLAASAGLRLSPLFRFFKPSFLTFSDIWSCLSLALSSPSSFSSSSSSSTSSSSLQSSSQFCPSLLAGICPQQTERSSTNSLRHTGKAFCQIQLATSSALKSNDVVRACRITATEAVQGTVERRSVRRTTLARRMVASDAPREHL